MEPAAERFETAHTQIPGAHQRLEISLNVTIFDRAAQLPAQRHAALPLLAKRLGEMPALAASAGLGLIERKVRILEQLVGACRIVRINRDPDRCANRHLPVAEIERSVEQPPKLLSN